MTAFQVMLFGAQSEDEQARIESVASSLAEAAAATGRAVPDTLITDHPMWLASATGGYAVALPDEDLGLGA